MHPQAAMHLEAKAFVDAVAGVIPRHILDRTRPQDAGAIEHPEVEQHLVKGHEIGRGAVASSPRDTSTPERGGVAICERLVLPARGALICTCQPIVQRIWYANT
jgi:hypothetical protein